MGVRFWGPVCRPLAIGSDLTTNRAQQICFSIALLASLDKIEADQSYRTRLSATLDHLLEPAKRNSHEVSRYNQRWVLNQLVSNPGICSKVCPLSQISSVPFHARKFCDE